MAHPAGGGLETWDALKWIIAWVVILGSFVYLPLRLCKSWPEVDLDEKAEV